MTGQGWARVCVGALLLAFGLAGASRLSAQATDVEVLRAQIRARYDVVPLQQGVALVPRGRGATVRMITIADGVVSIDGEVATGRQLNERLGRDAGLVVQISYLDRAAQQALAVPPEGLDRELSSDLSAEERRVLTDRGIVTAPRGRVRFGDRVRFGGNVTVSKDERIQGDVVAIFGGADIDGEVTSDVTVFMGSLNLGPNAVVRNGVVVGGRLTRAPTAVVTGRIDEIDISRPASTVFSHMGFGGPGPIFLHRPWPMSAPAFFAGGTVVRMVLLVLLGFLAIALSRAGIQRIGQRAAAAPLRAGIVGLLAEIMFVPVLVGIVIVLAVSIVGIPLLLLVPFAVGAFLIVMLVGFTAAAYQVGTSVARRMGLSDQGGFLPLVIGVLMVMGLTLASRLLFFALGGLFSFPLVAVGYLVEYLAWTIGFGAAILTWFDRRTTTPTVPLAT